MIQDNFRAEYTSLLVYPKEGAGWGLADDTVLHLTVYPRVRVRSNKLVHVGVNQQVLSYLRKWRKIQTGD